MAQSLIDSLVMEQQTPRPCGRDFLFTVPEAAVKAESARVMNFIAGSVQLPGFRQGKAPLNLVKSKYADAIRDELRNRCVSAAAEKIEKLEDIDVLTLSFKEQPDIRDGEEIKFSFTADVAPEFDLGDYKSIKVDIPLDQVTDEDIDKKIELYRGMYGTYAESMTKPRPRICSRSTTRAITLFPRMRPPR